MTDRVCCRLAEGISFARSYFYDVSRRDEAYEKLVEVQGFHAASHAAEKEPVVRHCAACVGTVEYARAYDPGEVDCPGIRRDA